MERTIYNGPERRWKPRYLRVGPLAIPYVTREKAIQTIERSFQDRQQIRVAFCNANTMLQALESRDYAEKLGSFLVLNDGIGVDLCSWLFSGERFADNLNGTDFVPDLLGQSRQRLKIYLLGGQPGVAEQAARRFSERYPAHSVVGARDGYFTSEQSEQVVRAINAAAPDLLLVALGNPRQEEFIALNRDRIEAPVLIGVGALLDFVAGRVVRAPRLVRACRAEWLFRLAQEPRRLGRRYTVDVARLLLAVIGLRLAGLVGGSSSGSGALQPQGPAPRLRPDN